MTSDAFRRRSRQAGDRPTAGDVMRTVTAYTEGYCQVGTAGGAVRRGGHTMAFWVGRDDITFYDPSHGEYWFESHAACQAWFNTYLSITDHDFSRMTPRFYAVAPWRRRDSASQTVAGVRRAG